MFLVWSSAAWAGELETFVGGAAAAGFTAFTESGVASADAVTTQVEADGIVGWGWGHARLDLDLHFDPNAIGVDGGEVVTYPSRVGGFPLWPEWAMVQLGREKYHARFGVYNPNVGVEDWEPWNNYAPTYSTNFTYVGSGRFAGTDVGLSTESGYDLFAFGGWDIDWSSFGGGVGVATEQDAFSTWSGILVYPEFTGGGCPGGEDTCLNAFGQLSFEVYPADPVWVLIEAFPGVKGGAFYTSTQLVVNVIPEAVVNPFARAEILIDPDQVTGAPGHTASLGVRTDTPEFLRGMLEAKAVFLPGGATDLGVAVTVAVHRPEPDAYSFTDPFGEEE
ncbi:MAG: hypothetical protein ABMA64_19395 [Myxococcota bacterium]